MRTIEDIERRFKEVSGLVDADLTVSHLQKSDTLQQKTTEDERKKFGFVCTPLWLVDEMIEPKIGGLTLTSRTCDACCGCGQFTVRLMRKMFNAFTGRGVSADRMNEWIDKVFLPINHFFTEFQPSNIAKLVYIFGTDINVYAGDTVDIRHADEDGNDHNGIMFFNEEGYWRRIDGLKERLDSVKDNLDILTSVFNTLCGKHRMYN